MSGFASAEAEAHAWPSGMDCLLVRSRHASAMGWLFCNLPLALFCPRFDRRLFRLYRACTFGYPFAVVSLLLQWEAHS